MRRIRSIGSRPGPPQCWGSAATRHPPTLPPGAALHLSVQLFGASGLQCQNTVELDKGIHTCGATGVAQNHASDAAGLLPLACAAPYHAIGRLARPSLSLNQQAGAPPPCFSVDHEAVRLALRLHQRLQLRHLVVHAQQAARVHKQHLWGRECGSKGGVTLRLSSATVAALKGLHVGQPTELSLQGAMPYSGKHPAISPCKSHTLRPFHSSGAACISLIRPNSALPVYLRADNRHAWATLVGVQLAGKACKPCSQSLRA